MPDKYECSEKERFGHIEEAIKNLQQRNGGGMMMKLIGIFATVLFGILIFIVTNQYEMKAQLAGINANQEVVMRQLHLR